LLDLDHLETGITLSRINQHKRYTERDFAISNPSAHASLCPSHAIRPIVSKGHT